MKSYIGEELKVGDKVLFITYYRDHKFAKVIGSIVKFTDIGCKVTVDHMSRELPGVKIGSTRQTYDVICKLADEYYNYIKIYREDWV